MTSAQADGATAGDDGADAWLTPGRFAALLGLLIAVCFPQVLAGLETFFYRDYALFGYPLAFHHKESFWRGELPLWNPLNNCGLPFTAQWNTLTLYPLSLFYLLFPLSWSLGVFCLGHLFLAGMGMYFLAHRWTGSRLAAAAAGVAFAYNGLTWHSLMWPNNIAALGWMPWVVLSAWRAWREGGRWTVLAALAGAMQMLAGAPEVILQTWFLLGVLGLAQLFTREIPWVKLAARACCVGLLVAALSAAQLLPFLDLLAHSQRDTGFSDSQWAMPVGGWANYLVPLFHCTAAGRDVYVQHNQFWTSSYFVGVGIVALALLAVWRIRSPRVWTLAAVALFSLTMALGDNGVVYTVLKKVAPQLGFMRFPIKFVVLATFAIPLLAAHAIAWLRKLPADLWPRERRRMLCLGVVLLALIVLILGLAAKSPQPGDDLGLTIRSGIRSIAFLGLIFGCLALLRHRPELKTQRILQTALVVLFWMNVHWHVPALSPTVPRRVYQADQIRQANQWEQQLQPGESRAMQTRDSLQRMHWNAVEDPEKDVWGRRVVLFDNLNLLDHVPKYDGFYSLYLKEMNDIVATLYYATNDAPGLEDFMGISHICRSTNELEWTKRETFLPLVTGGQQPVFADDSLTLKGLFDPSFDGRKNVYLPPETKTLLRASNHAAAKVISTDVSARRIGIQVEAAGSAMVVVAQAYYHPWTARVDGQPTPLLRANHAFQALEVPAGQHQVELVYRDRMFSLGGWIALAALLVCGAVWKWMTPAHASRIE